MNKELVKQNTFLYNGNNVRMELVDNEPWFIAKDVCDILGYNNVAQTISDHCKEKGVSKRYTPTKGGNQKVTFINEANLYRLTFKSKMPNAENFTDWISEEVIPSIRKTGSYGQTKMTPQQLMAHALIAANDTINEQKAMLEITTPKAAALDILADKDGSFCIRDAAKLLQIRPIDLTQYLSSNKWIYKRLGNSEWVAYQNHLQNNDLEHKITTVTTNSGDREKYQVRVTHKGLTRLSRLIHTGTEEKIEELEYGN